MDFIFNIVDKTGRNIHLTKERWNHIVRKHPDMSDKTEEIKLTLTNPVLVTSHKYDEAMRNYYKYQKETHDYLLVVVKYLNGEGYIASAFTTSKLKKNE